MDMGNDAATPANSPPPSTAASPPQAAAQEAPQTQFFPDWPALYSSAAATPSAPQLFYPPHLWGRLPGDRTPPHPYMMAPPYGAPFAVYPPVYPSGGPVYAHPSIAAGSVYIAAEAERRMAEANKSMEGLLVNQKHSTKAASGSMDEDTSQSDSESEGSSEDREGSIDRQSKKNFSSTFGDGGITQHATYIHHTSSSADSAPATKLPVSAPGRTLSQNPETDLNVGMGLLNASDASLKIGHNAFNIGPPIMVGREELAHGQSQMPDEREMRKERRKQSNRESARRSRLRKQQECEDLTRRVDELSNDNSALRSELEHLNKECEDMEVQNDSIEEELIRWYGPGILSELKAINDDSSMDGET